MGMGPTPPEDGFREGYMESRAWTELLERIPPAQHDNLILMTTIGTEISFQSILQMQGECLIIRGRLAGTTDTGRVFFIPYDQINSLGFIKAVPEAEVLAMFGLEAPTVVAAAVSAPAETAAAAEAPAPTEAPPVAVPVVPEPAPPPQPPKAPSRPAMPDKAKILERLRARSHSSGSNQAEDR
jgi:hypothetical protein